MAESDERRQPCFWCHRTGTEGGSRRGRWLCPDCLVQVDRNDIGARMEGQGYVRPHACPGCYCAWVKDVARG